MEKRQSNNKNGSKVFEQMGFPVHSQVRKIKQESEKITDWSPGQPEIKLSLPEFTRQRSRSPLGITSGQPISVGDS